MVPYTHVFSKNSAQNTREESSHSAAGQRESERILVFVVFVYFHLGVVE